MKTNSLILLQNRIFSIKMLISLYKWPPTIIFPSISFLGPPHLFPMNVYVCEFKRLSDHVYDLSYKSRATSLQQQHFNLLLLRFIFPRSGDKENTMSPHTPRIIKLRNDFSMEIEAIDWIRSPPPTIKYTCSKIKSPPVIAWPTI